MRDSKRDGRLLEKVVLVLGAASMFFLTAWPHGQWTPPWGNFAGALFVAAGGLLASAHAYKLVKDWAIPISWSFIVIGSFGIAGASLQMALTPDT